MFNLAKSIQDEIIRLSRKEIREALSGLKASNSKLRKDLKALRQEFAASAKTAKVKAVAEVRGIPAKPATTKIVSKIRPTGESVRALRDKFGMSQQEFSRLCGVNRVTLARWETTDGKIQFKGGNTRETFAKIIELGKKEAWSRIGGKAARAK